MKTITVHKENVIWFLLLGLGFLFCTFDKVQWAETCSGLCIEPHTQFSWVSIISQTTWFLSLSVETSLLQHLMFPKRVHVKLIFPLQKRWFPPFYEHRSWWCGSLFSLSYEKLSKSGDKSYNEALSLAHDSMLSICCISLRRQNHPHWIRDSVFLERPQEQRESTPKTEPIGRNSRNPCANAKPQLPLPPSNQIKITFIWDLWKPSRSHTQNAENPVALKSISLPCFPHTLKITTQNLDQCLNEANSSPAPLLHFELAQFLKKNKWERFSLSTELEWQSSGFACLLTKKDRNNMQNSVALHCEL